MLPPLPGRALRVLSSPHLVLPGSHLALCPGSGDRGPGTACMLPELLLELGGAWARRQEGCHP